MTNQLTIVLRRYQLDKQLKQQARCKHESEAYSPGAEPDHAVVVKKWCAHCGVILGVRGLPVSKLGALYEVLGNHYEEEAR